MIITKTIGIDLGTTNSAVAMLEMNEQDLVLWKDKQGRSTTPSCVWCDPGTKDIVVGHRAYARKGTSPEPVSSVKRSMGAQMTVPLGDKQRTPSEISAYILRELKKQMETDLEHRSPDGLQYEVNRAIVTVPAYFGLPAIEATREAGKLAGLEVMELLHEPTAAAIYYSWKHNLGDGIYLVYDLGGGTFDVSILRRISGEFQVLGISGDNFLGGDEFDRRLAEHIRKLLAADDYDLDLDVDSDPEDRLRFNQLVTLAERAKKELSEKEEIILRDQGTLRDKSGLPVIVEIPISRTEFENLIDDLLERTLVSCEKALEKAYKKSEITIEDVDHILLVGGSTYVPAVLEKVKKAFCRNDTGNGKPRAAVETPIRDEPETAVAFGAALRAAASGLGISDDDRHVRLWFRGMGTTKREAATISGHIEPLREDLSLEGGLLRLIAADGGQLGEVKLDTEMRFVFSKVPIRAESLNDFRFEVWNSSGEMVAVLQRSIVHSKDQKQAVGRTLSTAVLSKPIVLEGTDGDRLIRRVLLAEGSSLPTRARFNFAVADPSGRIRLPIYQENRIVKELKTSVGEVPVGTPVEVEISCDEQVRIQVQFSINDHMFKGSIEPPPPDSVQTEYEIQGIDERFQEVLQRLEEEDAQRLSEAYDRTRGDLNEARDGADYPKVIQRAADLEGLFREARLSEPLKPPLDVVENNFSSCLQLLPKALEVKPELAESSLKKDLETAMERSREAYRQRDRQTYEDASQVIGTAMQFLVGLTHESITGDREVDSAVQALMALEQTRQLIRFLLINCLMSGRKDFFKDLTQHIEELKDLEEDVNVDPVGVLNRCRVLMTEAQRIHKQISPEEKHGADLEGLLRLGEQKHTPDLGASGGLFDMG